MKKFIQSLGLVAFILASVNLSAQEKMAVAENPEIMEYAKALDLNEEQQVLLKEIYGDSEMKLKANQEEMTKLRMQRVEKSTPVTAEEKAAWSEKMDRTSKEQRMLVDERNKKMLDILTDEQLVKYKELKQSKVSGKSDENLKKAPVREATPQKKK